MSAAASRAEPPPRKSFLGGIAATAGRELAAYFDSSIAYVALVVGLVSATTLYMNEFFLTGRLDMTPFFESLSWISILLACAISMRTWSEDLRTRTFAAFLPTAAVGTLLWMHGGGRIAPLLLGMGAGYAATVGALICLFRLRPVSLLAWILASAAALAISVPICAAVVWLAWLAFGV